MTEEVRQFLCRVACFHGLSDSTYQGMQMLWLRAAAAEIERLAADVEHWKMIANRAYIDSKPLAQSDAEPVAWRWRYPHGGWAVHTSKPCGAEDCIVEPLYAAPPRPDASAGLIEAAENVVIAFGMGWDMEGVIERLIETLPQDSVCRARAAERSGK